MINQKVVLGQVRRLGHQADAVADGNKVLTALQRVPYDLILMDCQMPELDGWEGRPVKIYFEPPVSRGPARPEVQAFAPAC
jgi:hypothetical protein